MNSTVMMDTIKALIEHKKYDAMTEYAKVLHGKDNLIVSEYGGTNVRLYKDNDNKVRLLCPKNMDVVQEGHVANAIANGSVFEDAEDIDKNAACIERLSIPYDAMVNSGRDVPQNLKPMIAIVIGKMNNDGSFDVGDDARNTGTNFVRDLSDAKRNGEKINGVVDNYVEKQPEGFYTPEIGKGITKLDREMGEVNDTDPADVVSDDDTVDSYDDVEVDDVETDEKADEADASEEDAPKTSTVDSSEEGPDVELGNEEESDEDHEGKEPSEEEDEATDEEADEADASNEDAPDTSTVNSSDDEKDFDDPDADDEDEEEVEEAYVEESLKVSRDDMKGEFMNKAPDGTYHSGKQKEKKPALKLNGNKIYAKTADLKNAMTGDFIRCVDDKGNVKMIKIIVGKPLIDKQENVTVIVDGDSAKITVPAENNSGAAKKTPTRKRKLVRTPFGMAETWVYEYANGEVFNEAVFVEEDEEVAAEEAGEEPVEDAGTETPTEDTTETGDAEPVETGDNETVEECGDAKIPVTPIQEGFLSKKPKKLKPINRDVVAYITVEMNNIHSSNDQAMLAGYTCSKIELVDWYITVIDTQDPKYIVPHTRQYLVSMKSQLESLLAQILKIRPINRSEQIWRINYPQAT